MRKPADADLPAEPTRSDREPTTFGDGADSDIRFRALFDRTSDGVFIYDLEGKIVDANQTAERLTGFPRDELIGRSFLDAAAPEERERARKVFATLLRGEKLDPYERVGRQKDGTELIIEINAALVRDRSGRPHHVQSVVRDITERKRAEAALRDSEERFRTLVEHAPEAIVVLDSERGVFVQVNENALKLFRCRREDLIERLGPVDVSPAEQPDGRPSRQAAAEYVARATRGETPAFEWTHRALDGVEILCEVRLARLSASYPNLIRGSMTDITERKRAERERRELEARVQQTQKLESLGVLAGGIAHDFNNLLVGVLGNATLALKELPEGHPVSERLKQVDLAARRASELTQQLLMYAGKGRLKQELTDLNQLLPEIEHLLGAAVPKKTTLRYELAAGSLLVLGDRSQLQQVAMNLITNAAEAMEEQGGTVTVRTSSETAPAADGQQAEDFHVLEVADDGPGIDEASRDRILEPFFSTKFTGRGLGLATVSGIVRSHRGRLEIDSEPGRGASFKVLLPAAEGPRQKLVVDPGDPEEWRGQGTILVADDEELVRSVLGQHLEHLGFDVIFARDGREAVNSYQNRRDDLVAVFMDQTMPRMDGVEAAAEIQRLGAEVPIVMLSGYAREEVAERIAQHGIADFIQKPFTMEDLRRTLRDLLAGRGG